MIRPALPPEPSGLPIGRLGPRAQQAAAMLDTHPIMETLAPWDPVVVGTLPLGIDVPGSDLDILCEVHDRKAFTDTAAAAFGRFSTFAIVEVPTTPGATVCRFEVEGLPVEIFAQPVPTRLQAGYRHMIVEARLLRQGGHSLRRRIRRLKEEGWKTEPAFARVLGLPGDPYDALLDLEALGDAALRTLIATRPERP